MVPPTDLGFDANLCQNEREVESKFIVSYLLPKLGYDIANWRQNYKSGRFRLDFVAYTGKNGESASKVVIEAKHPCKRLPHGRYQLKNYMLRLGIDYGLLTNGQELVIYKRFGNNRVDSVFACRVADISNHIHEVKALIGRPHVLIADVSEDIAETTAAVSLAKDISDNGTKELIEVVAEEIVETAENTAIVQEVPTVSPDDAASLTEDKSKQSPPDLGNMKILAIFHNKGGVGKTTTTVNLADAIARTGKKVLIIDMDSQANATFATGLMNFADELADDIKDNYVYHLLHDPDLPIDKVARKSRYSNQDIDVVPAHILLMEKEKYLADSAFIMKILPKKLSKSSKPYDVVIIDTPPSLGLYTKISLFAAGYLLIPSDLKVFANSGLENVKSLVSQINATKEMHDLPNIEVLGILPTKILNNVGHIKGIKNQRIPRIEAIYGLPVLKDHMILERIALARCFDTHIEVGDLDIPDPKSIFVYESGSDAVVSLKI